MGIPIIPEVMTLTQVKQAGQRLFQKKQIRKVVEEMAVTAKAMWDKGWAERNAGNISVNITALVPLNELSKLASFPFFPMPKSFPNLANNVFLVTTSGSRMREMAENPVDNLCFIYISENGSAYHIVAVTEDIKEIRPTSELLTHLGIHKMLLAKKRPEKVVVHAHVTELIALSHIPSMKSDESINNALLSMHPEIGMFLPEGAGFVPFETPGSEPLAQATVTAFESRKAVIWEKHGCLAVGETVSDAFDTMDILAKAAGIWFLIKTAGGAG